MKYSNEKSKREKEDPAVILLGGLAFIIFVILFCIIVWSVTHKGGNDIKIDSSSVIVSSETSSSETSVSTDVVVPIESSSEETEELSGVDYNDTSNDMGLKFTPVEDMVTAKDVTNLRSEPSTSQGAATVLAKLRNGEIAVRIGKEETTGWSKLVYNGQIMYASTNYLLVVEQDEE